MLKKAVMLTSLTEIIYISFTICFMFLIFGSLIFEPIVLVVMYCLYMCTRSAYVKNILKSLKGFLDYEYR